MTGAKDVRGEKEKNARGELTKLAECTRTVCTSGIVFGSGGGARDGMNLLSYL